MKTIQLITTLIAALAFIVIFGGAFAVAEFELFSVNQYVEAARTAAMVGAPSLFVSYLFAIAK